MSEKNTMGISERKRHLFEDAKRRLIEGLEKLSDEDVGYFNHAGAMKGRKELQDQFNAELKKIKALDQE